MKSLPKLLFRALLIFILFFIIGRLYLKHTALNLIGEAEFQALVSTVKSTPALPQTFKTTYAKVYPGVFENSMTKGAVAALFQRTQLPCFGRFVANEYWHWFAGSGFQHKLNYVGFVWLLEDEVSQEKCFEYYLSRFDFLHNTKGPHEAAEFYYHKSLDSLNIDEQLGLILKIQNPAYFDETKNRERCAAKVIELRERIKEY